MATRNKLIIKTKQVLAMILYMVLGTFIMNWIKKLLGIEELIREIKETNRVLRLIEENTRKTKELQERYNSAYHIR